MPAVVRADLLGALIAQVRASSEVTAIASARVSAEIQDVWAMPIAAVVLRRAGGPPGQYSIGLWRSRVDVICYGTDGRNAGILLDTVLGVLVPSQPAQASFRRTVTGSGIVRVMNIEPEADSISGREPDTGWAFCWMPLIVTWSGIPT